MVFLLPLVWFGCGWHAGLPPSLAFSVAPVEAVSVEPGLRATLAGALTRGLRQAGGGAGPALLVRVDRFDQMAEAAIPGVDSGVVGFTTRMHLHWELAEHLGCTGDFDVVRTWVQPPGIIDADSARSQARQDAADEATRRVVAALLAEDSCR